MSIVAQLCFEHDLEKGVTRTLLPHSLLTGDENAHEFIITLKRGGADADLTGATVNGYFVRADGVTVFNEGTIDGNNAKVKLIGNCYQHAGRYNLYIKLTKGEETVTIFWGTGSENMTSTDTVVVDENIIPSVKELLDRLEEGISDEIIAASVDKYLEENPIEAGATAEEAAQIEQNRIDIEALQKTGGTPGKDGVDGEDGATFTPSVDAEGNLSWTNDKGLQNPVTVNIKGGKGDTGETGAAGADGADGVSVTNATINASGYLVITLSNGNTINAGLVSGGESSGGGAAGVGIESIEKTSTSGLVDTYTITLTDGNTSTFTVTNGEKGDEGDPGESGATFTPSVDAAGNLSWSNDKGLENPAPINIKGEKGDPGDNAGGTVDEYGDTIFDGLVFANGERTANNRLITYAELTELTLTATYEDGTTGTFQLYGYEVTENV